jgi:hypothetical protein
VALDEVLSRYTDPLDERRHLRVIRGATSWAMAPERVVGAVGGADRLRGVDRPRRWLLPTVLAVLVIIVVIGALFT